ncbi:MAG TPA: hypothetical protein PKD37_07870 [Oligoflexia bacterium]|nr:hypothetical protein [Oligoflexia bacterium]HMP27880.1 hypothetical protein [Oligoflexia bacterium]
MRGNNAEAWDLLVQSLDDKLQFALLERIKRVAAYHLEDTTLIIQPGNADDFEYLNTTTILQQLSIFAEAAIGVKEVKLAKNI